MKRISKYNSFQLQIEKFFLQLVILLLLSDCVFSQEPNLIRNSSFEQHAKINEIDLLSSEWFDNHIKEWSDLNSGSILCDCKYTFTELEKHQGVPIRNCLKSAFIDNNNCTYTELEFVSHITNDLNLKYSPGKDASYISQKFKKK